MVRIDSPDNATYKELKRIRTKGAATGFVLLEGERALRQLQADGRSFSLFVREEEHPDGRSIRADLFDRLCRTQSPQGILMKLAIPPERAFDGGPVLVLDRITDPGNLGTLLRSAMAFGVRNILCLEGSVDVCNDKVLRASLGAVLSLAIRQQAGVSEVVALQRPLFLADLGGDDFASLDYPDNFALIIGNEANGPRDALKALAPTVVTIPMKNKIESLNAAVAGGILLQAMVRRRK